MSSLGTAVGNHLNENWTNHVGAGTATVMSLVNGQAVIQSVLIGVSVFVITSALKWVWSKLTG
jgi:hypothetical protein